jgi:hypothetical protein
MRFSRSGKNKEPCPAFPRIEKQAAFLGTQSPHALIPIQKALFSKKRFPHFPPLPVNPTDIQKFQRIREIWRYPKAFKRILAQRSTPATTAMMHTEKAAAWFTAPRSSRSRTETAATWVDGVMRKITALRVTMLRMKKKTPTPTRVGHIRGKMTLLRVRIKVPPKTAEASS